MQDISVIYLSQVELPAGAGHYTHVHDYWHFSLALRGKPLLSNGSVGPSRQRCTCYPAGEINSAGHSLDNHYAINVMFLVHDKGLARRLAFLPFSQLNENEIYTSVLQDIMKQACELHPEQGFIDAAFSYYLHLLLATYEKRRNGRDEESLVEKMYDYIERNYMNQIQLEKVAEHIGRSPFYTSRLFKENTGISIVEHIRAVRIKNACYMLAYSAEPIESIISACGFIDQSYFYRIFKCEVGITPNRYRTSHSTRHTYYDGDDAALDIPYNVPVFTYIPRARKCVEWKTPREYLAQKINN